ncbi:AAA family ATPase [Streptomyces sp. NBC_01754]|uniref:AAA family ATPase n=1 Tax=Streptomyces sp. NBC_01754 TaxID=2975930 RepID=UPI003FA3B1E5
MQEDSKQRTRVEHRTDDGVFPLDLKEESSGTRTWIGLVGPVVTTLTDGGVLCVDELDARPHPYLVDALVGMFQSARRGPDCRPSGGPRTTPCRPWGTSTRTSPPGPTRASATAWASSARDGAEGRDGPAGGGDALRAGRDQGRGREPAR